MASLQIFERGWLSSNNILFQDADAAVLVDTGYVAHAGQTVSLVEHALQGRQLDRIINTHLHSDHCGGNALLQARYSCRTAIPLAEGPKVAAWDEAALSYRATGQRCTRFVAEDLLAPGQQLRLGGQDWQALAAPGHDPHSLMLFCAESGVLISADALWENGFGVIFPELEGASGFAEARASLDLIASLPVRQVIPGHGAPFLDVAGALARAYGRLDYLAADPRRNAENAIKVLLKFLLLEHQRLPLPGLGDWLEAIPIVAAARQHWLGMDSATLADWTAQALQRAGAARMEDGFLYNC